MFRVEIETSNAAFTDGESEFAGPELARILRYEEDRDDTPNAPIDRAADPEYARMYDQYVRVADGGKA